MSVLPGPRCGALGCPGWWPLFTLGDRFGVAAAVGLPLTRWRHGATRHAKSPTVASGALRFPLPSLWDALPVLYVAKAWPSGSQRPGRSEEHTSELQSRENLVCRLLLEKKKNFTIRSQNT